MAADEAATMVFFSGPIEFAPQIEQIACQR